MEIAAAVPPTADQARFLDRLDQLSVSHPANGCARYLSRDLFLSFDAAGRERLMRACRSGLENPDSRIGCYIARPEDLHDFAAVLGPLIGELHDPRPATGQGTLDLSTLDLSTVGLPILSTRVRAARNLQGFPLPAAMDRADRIALERAMVAALQVLVDDPAYGGRIFSLTPDFGPDSPNPNLIDPAQHQALVDAHLMFRDMTADPYMASAGLAADWPHGRAAYISADRAVAVWIGEEDHLRVISLTPGAQLAQAYGRLREVLAAIAAIPGVAFLHDAAHGYVTSCPSNLGGGLRPSVRVTLPALVQPGVDPQALCRPFGLDARGPAGDHAPIGADGRMDLSPIRRVGVGDADVLGALVKGLGRWRVC